MVGLETRKYNGNVIIVLEKEKATKYLEMIIDGLLWGCFVNDDMDILGINTYSQQDVFSPNKIKKQIQHFLRNEENVNEHAKESPLEWWNNINENEWRCKTKRNMNFLHDVKIKEEDMEKYFNKTIEKSTECTFTTYYIKPACGFKIRIGDDVEVNFNDRKVEKIVMYEAESEKYSKSIYCYDEKDIWLEDIDIQTNNEIKFIFDEEDLEKSATQCNEEMLSYIELWEKINPYDDMEEIRKEVKEWMEKNHAMLQQL